MGFGDYSRVLMNIRTSIVSLNVNIDPNERDRKTIPVICKFCDEITSSLLAGRQDVISRMITDLVQNYSSIRENLVTKNLPKFCIFRNQITETIKSLETSHPFTKAQTNLIRTKVAMLKVLEKPFDKIPVINAVEITKSIFTMFKKISEIENSVSKAILSDASVITNILLLESSFHALVELRPDNNSLGSDTFVQLKKIKRASAIIEGKTSLVNSDEIDKINEQNVTLANNLQDLGMQLEEERNIRNQMEREIASLNEKLGAANLSLEKLAKEKKSISNSQGDKKVNKKPNQGNNLETLNKLNESIKMLEKEKNINQKIRKDNENSMNVIKKEKKALELKIKKLKSQLEAATKKKDTDDNEELTKAKATINNINLTVAGSEDKIKTQQERIVQLSEKLKIQSENLEKCKNQTGKILKQAETIEQLNETIKKQEGVIKSLHDAKEKGRNDELKSLLKQVKEQTARVSQAAKMALSLQDGIIQRDSTINSLKSSNNAQADIIIQCFNLIQAASKSMNTKDFPAAKKVIEQIVKILLERAKSEEFTVYSANEI